MQTDMNKLFAEGGVMQEGGTVDPVSGNEVPPGAMQEEVRDDVDAKLSEGEFVMPADVVRYIGLETLMKLRDKAKMGLKKMEEIGQMGNADSVPDAEALHGGEDEMDDETFSSEIDSILGEDEGEEKEYAAGGYVAPTSAQITGQNQQATNELAASGTTTQYADAPLKGFEMVAMVNDAGQTIYIPFIDGVPQLSVPEGYKVKKTTDTTTPADDATKPTTPTQGGAGSSNTGSDSANTGLTKEQEATFDFMNTPEGASYKEAYGKANNGLIGSILGFVIPGLNQILDVPKNPIEQFRTANNVFKEATEASKTTRGVEGTTRAMNDGFGQTYGTTGAGSAVGIGVGSTTGINAMDEMSDAASARGIGVGSTTGINAMDAMSDAASARGADIGGYGTTGAGAASGVGVGSTEGINSMDAMSDAATGNTTDTSPSTTDTSPSTTDTSTSDTTTGDYRGGFITRKNPKSKIAKQKGLASRK